MTPPPTPAPAQLEQWLASNEADELRDDIYRVDVYSDGSPKGSRLPAQVYGRTAAEALRRGKLIAATPAMYAILRKICKDAGECEMRGDEPSQVDGIQWEDIVEARAALAQAEGRNP